MVKRLNLILDDDVHARLKQLKQELGLTWEELLIKGAECLASTKKKEVMERPKGRLF